MNCDSNAHQWKKEEKSDWDLILFFNHFLACEMMPTGIMWPTSSDLKLFVLMTQHIGLEMNHILLVCLALVSRFMVQSLLQCCVKCLPLLMYPFLLLSITLIVIYTFILADWRLCSCHVISAVVYILIKSLWKRFDLVYKRKDNQLWVTCLKILPWRVKVSQIYFFIRMEKRIEFAVFAPEFYHSILRGKKDYFWKWHWVKTEGESKTTVFFQTHYFSLCSTAGWLFLPVLFVPELIDAVTLVQPCAPFDWVARFSSLTVKRCTCGQTLTEAAPGFFGWCVWHLKDLSNSQRDTMSRQPKRSTKSNLYSSTSQTFFFFLFPALSILFKYTWTCYFEKCFVF